MEVSHQHRAQIQLAEVLSASGIKLGNGSAPTLTAPWYSKSAETGRQAFVLGQGEYFIIRDPLKQGSPDANSEGTIGLQLDHQKFKALSFANSTELATHLVSLNQLCRQIRQVQENILQAIEKFPDQMMMTTSGGRNAAFLISVVAEMAINPMVDANVRANLRQMPIVFIDLQDHPKETYTLLREIREIYPYINLRRFTHALDNESLEAEIKLRIRRSNGDLDPVSAYFDVVKTPLIPAIIKHLASEGLQVNALISGNRRDQTKSRQNISVFSEQRLGEVKLHKVFPAAEVSGAVSKLYRALAELPEHKLDAAVFPSVGIYLEMDPQGVMQGSGEKTGRTADECRMHHQHQKLADIPTREILDWDEFPKIEPGLRSYLQERMKEYADSRVQI